MNDLNRLFTAAALGQLSKSDAGADTIRTTTLETLSASKGRWSADVKPAAGRGAQYTIDQSWLPGLGGALNDLARKLRRQLQREPDIGDLLIALACTSETLASQAPHRLGIEPDQLEGEINTVRAEAQPAQQAHESGSRTYARPRSERSSPKTFRPHLRCATRSASCACTVSLQVRVVAPNPAVL